MRRFVLAAAAAAALMAPVLAQVPAAGPNTWQVDPAHSSAGFSVRHMMVSTVRGTLGPIKGTIEYDGTSAQSIKADITIDVTAINTGNSSRDNDLKSANFFDVATYSTLTFKSKRVDAVGGGKFKLVGDLTMHGVTKEVTLDVEGPSPALKTPNGAQRVGASVSTKLNRREFNLQYNAMIEAAPVVSDDVQIQIDIEATKRG